MGNSYRDSFEKSRNTVENALRHDLLDTRNPEKNPETLDWLAGKMAKEGKYFLNMVGTNPQVIGPNEFVKAAPEPYLNGLAKRTGNSSYRHALDDEFNLGNLLIQYAGLIDGLDSVRDAAERAPDDDFYTNSVDPGEVLGRLVSRDLQRETSGLDGQTAFEFRSDTRTPRELVEQICAQPRLSKAVQKAIPTTSKPNESLVHRLGEVELVTELWEHQREAIIEWLAADGKGYVNMATATGKTVLGLAAVGHCTPNGSLHPTDERAIRDYFEERDDTESVPNPSAGRADDILIVTIDELLGVQWGRLFQEHCNTPEEFTQVVDQKITLPWGSIDIRSAASIDDLEPKYYRLAIFDEVHNYSKGDGWGRNLTRFINSDCPVLALTGSVKKSFHNRVEQSKREFPEVYEYTHDQAKTDGIIPDFEWTLNFVPVDTSRSDTLDTLKTAAREYGRRMEFDGEAIRLTETALSDVDGSTRDELAGEFSTPISLARALKAAGKKGRAPTDKLDDLASALLGRQMSWWHLRTDLNAVVDIIDDAVQNERPSLVLTRSYEEAEVVKETIHSLSSNARVICLDPDSDASGQDDQITTFDEINSGRKVLVGPGDRIGMGNDIQTVEVGVNIAKPGTGVSATLVQRLGRLLRNADKGTVDFHHVMGLPPESAIAPTDGEQFLRNAAGFFTQAVAPSDDGGISEIPHVTIHSGIEPVVAALERHGIETLEATQAPRDDFEAAYIAAIKTAGDKSTIDTPWWEDVDRVSGEAAGRTAESVEKKTDSSLSNSTETAIEDVSSDDTDAPPTVEEKTKADGYEDKDDMTTKIREESSKENGKEVEIDGALVALVDLAVDSSKNSYQTQSEFAADALEEFLDTVILNDSNEISREITSERTFDCEADPVVDHLLQMRIRNSDEYETATEFVRDALFSKLGIESSHISIGVDNYDHYSFVVERLLKKEDCPYDTVDELVHAALEKQLRVPAKTSD